MRTRYRAYTPNTRRFASGWLRQAPPGVLEALRGNTLPPAVRQLLLQARGPDELDTTAAAVEDEAMEETAVITVFWAEGAAMPTADEIYFLGLMLVAGAPDMQLDLTAWSADVLAIQGPLGPHRLTGQPPYPKYIPIDFYPPKITTCTTSILSTGQLLHGTPTAPLMALSADFAGEQTNAHSTLALAQS